MLTKMIYHKSNTRFFLKHYLLMTVLLKVSVMSIGPKVFLLS